MRGKITQWKDDKGFGFIVSEDNGEKLFFHISAVKTNSRRPQVGDTVLYESMRDSQDRPKAKTVVIEGVAPEQKTAGKKRIHTAPPKKDALDYISIVLAIFSLVGAVYVFFQTENIEKTIPFAAPLLIAIALLNRQKKPKEKAFSCARCKKIARHDKRTIKAWNNGFLKLYCKACHLDWLAQQPRQTHYISTPNQRGGCLGVVALLLILPLAAGVGMHQWLM